MNQNAEQALLPVGIADALPPDAAFEAATVERLMGIIAANGYERVQPPLVEFEESLLAGSGAALASQTFRLMDPLSQRMLALRPDMTIQVARIASTRLGGQPRPLRLGYAGQVVRVRGSQLRPQRQVRQVGAELLGAPTPAADAEIIVLAAEALEEIGVNELTIDLGLPTLVPALLGDAVVDERVLRTLRVVLDRKDAGAVDRLKSALGGSVGGLLVDLLGAAGPAEECLPRLMAIDLPPSAAAEREALASVYERVRLEAPDLRISIDPTENRGFEYHTGVTFTIFARSVKGELGRGGRYRAGNTANEGEAATGVTLFMNAVLRALQPPPSPARVFVPYGVTGVECRRLRREGWIVTRGLEPESAAESEARRLKCSHVYDDGRVKDLAVNA